MSSASKVLSIRLAEDEFVGLTRAATEAGIPLSGFAKLALARGLSIDAAVTLLLESQQRIESIVVESLLRQTVAIAIARGALPTEAEAVASRSVADYLHSLSPLPEEVEGV
ncbi:hypothetical protein GH865_12895 [Rhodocyclus tenuis]|uniref:Uncharacterized protein n=1 Tax=Rhodocyclus tenuis TaxID=1066 RepID=A0A6L5JW57_RHOTE|nr:hypothetical protein [Rhodocyclus gracilis]MQY51296.1 hypothetical protein [Rhodocyclus gracilis]MRD74137.1 hypothetical protein [Rhodocyclus gracilis]